MIWAGRRSPSAWEELAGDYRRRIEAFHPIEERAVPLAPGAFRPAQITFSSSANYSGLAARAAASASPR